jgi:hypothetical protein
MRRLVQRLVEATYARDADVRAQGERFYADLRAYLTADPAALARRLGDPAPDGAWMLRARAFTDVGPTALWVMLAPGDGVHGGGVGTYRGDPVLVLRSLKAPGDLAHVATRLNRDVVVHEVAHLLDPGRGATGSAARADRGDVAGYYRTPGEWNAYWQEGAANAERLLRGEAGRNPRVRAFLFGDGTLRGLAQRVDKLWDKGFLQAMDAPTRRRFDKRLAALWQQWKDEWLL